MGQKVNPVGLRLGINRTWDSRWYAGGGAYGDLLTAESKAFLGRGQTYAGGSDRGFMIMFVNDPDNTVIVTTNSRDDLDPRNRALVRALIGLAEAS